MNISLKRNIFSEDALSREVFKYTGSPEKIILPPGVYSLELYGANLGSPKGGKGGYVSATFIAANTTELYLYVGGRGGDGTSSATGSGGWNGGGNGGKMYPGYANGAGGGGATDIRTAFGRWDENLEKRLIVAGGGGGQSGHPGQAGGNGGGLDGSPSKHVSDTACSNLGSDAGKKETGYGFGFGQNGKNGIWGSCMCEGSGGGGGGWFGGYVRTDHIHTFGGGGGSGYVSPLLLNPGFANGKNTRDDGNGYIIIRKLRSISSKRCQTSHRSLVLEATLFLTEEFEGG